MKMPILKAVPLTALLLSPAFAAAPDAASLTGVVWTMTQIAPRGEGIRPGSPLRKPTLKIMPGGMLSGITGCNGFSGWATVKGQSLKVTPLKLSGKSNCTDHALSLEADFVNLLQGATLFDVAGQTLTIRGAGNAFVTFQASKGVNNVTGDLPHLTSMKGQWQLSKLLHRGQFVKVLSDSVLTVQDTAAGLEVRGSAGCNILFGKMILTGRTLSVTDLGMTMMLCEDMTSENAVVDILRVPVTLAVTGNGNTMIWRNGRGEMTLNRVVPALGGFQEKDLEGRTFTLNTVAGRAVPRTVNPVTLTFGSGDVSGSDGCNRFSGSAAWQGARLSVSKLASTRRFCEGMEKVPNLTAFLESNPTVELNGKTLRLAANGLVWVFVEP